MVAKLAIWRRAGRNGDMVPAIPERTTVGDIANARALLLDDLLGDFPFTSLAERAHAVAARLAHAHDRPTASINGEE